MTLPGPFTARAEQEQNLPSRSPSKGGINKVNEFRYKSNFTMADLSGSKMFEKKESFLF